MHRRTLAAGLVVAMALVVSGCSGDDDGGGFSVEAALEELPDLDVDIGLQISMADLDAASEVADVGRPPADAGREDSADWLIALTGGAGERPSPIFVAVPEDLVSLPDLGAQRGVVGVTILDAESFATVSAPPETFTVLTGVLDAELANDLIEVADGVFSNDDGADYEVDPRGDRDVDRLGRPVRFAQDGERVASSVSTPLVEGWAAGDGTTLAGDESLAAIAGALDDAEVVSAALFTFPEAAKGPIALGLGWATDGGDTVVTAVYDYGDDEAASATVEVLETAFREGSSLATGRPIADYVDLDEVETDGRLVIATMELGPEGRAITPYQMVIQRDLPFTGS